MFTVWFQMVRRGFSRLRRATSHVPAPLRPPLCLLCVVTVWPVLWWWRHVVGTAMIFMHFVFRGNLCTARALHAHCALLLDYVPPEEPPSTPLGNALRIR